MTARKTKATADALARLKLLDPEAWKAKVRATRIRTDPGQPGLDGLLERRRAAATFEARLSQFVQIKDMCRVMWLTMRQFVAWHKQWEGMSEEEANAKWTADSANPDIRSIGDGAMKRLAVEGIPETQGARGRTLEKVTADGHHDGELR